MSSDAILARLEATSILTLDEEFGQGTAHFVAQGIAATANHCVGTWEEGETYEVRVGGSHSARVAKARVLIRNEKADIALLTLENCDDIVPFPLGTSPTFGSKWHSFGYPTAVANADDGVLGIPIQGEVRYASWRNEKERVRILLASTEASAGQGVGVGGCSGAAVLVNGAVAGILVKQLGDPDDRTKVAYGLLQACPIEDVIALLEKSGVPFEKARAGEEIAAPGGRVAPPNDPERIVKLLAWCDREKVVEAVVDWIDRPDGPRAGLLCLSGHTDHRPVLLCDRVADELGTPPHNMLARHRAIIAGNKFDSAEAFRKAALHTLHVKQESELLKARLFQDGAKLVLLSATCECLDLSANGIAQTILNAARAIGGLDTGGRRLLVVVTLLFEKDTLSWLDRLRGRVTTRQRVDDAIDAVCEGGDAQVSASLIAKPIKLADFYTRNHFHDWQHKDSRVEQALGATWAAIDDDVISSWFKDGQCAPGELNRRLKEFHEQNLKR